MSNLNSKINYNFNYNLLKGKIAEKLIEQLFMDLGFEVYPYGVEVHIPNYQKLLKRIGDKKAKTLKPFRNFPDFVIVSENNQQVFFLDVKYRKNGEKDLKKISGYNFDVIYILISSDGIYCLDSSNFSNKVDSEASLENYSRFEFSDLQKKIIREAEAYCKMLFSSLPKNYHLTNKIIEVQEPVDGYN